MCVRICTSFIVLAQQLQHYFKQCYFYVEETNLHLKLCGCHLSLSSWCLRFYAKELENDQPANYWGEPHTRELNDKKCLCVTVRAHVRSGTVVIHIHEISI